VVLCSAAAEGLDVWGDSGRPLTPILRQSSRRTCAETVCWAARRKNSAAASVPCRSRNPPLQQSPVAVRWWESYGRLKTAQHSRTWTFALLRHCYGKASACGVLLRTGLRLSADSSSVAVGRHGAVELWSLEAWEQGGHSSYTLTALVLRLHLGCLGRSLSLMTAPSCSACGQRDNRWGCSAGDARVGFVVCFGQPGRTCEGSQPVPA
jgi:hypothetical protein